MLRDRETERARTSDPGRRGGTVGPSGEIVRFGTVRGAGEGRGGGRGKAKARSRVSVSGDSRYAPPAWRGCWVRPRGECAERPGCAQLVAVG